MPRILAVVCAVALSFTLMGCQASRDEPPIDVSRVSYPLDSYRFAPDEQDLLDRATYELTSRCVERFGLTLPARGRPRDLRPYDRYGLVDEQHAKVFAYSLDIPTRRASAWFVAIDQRSRLFSAVTGHQGDSQQPPLKDLPQGGCSGEAQRALLATTVPREDPVPDLDREAWNASMKDDKVVEATKRWHRCMRDAGHRYADPVGSPYGYWGEKRMARFAALSPEQKKAGIKPSGEEIEAALADVRCKRSSGLLASWIAADIAHQRVLVERDRGLLDDHRRYLDGQLARAEAVLAP